MKFWKTIKELISYAKEGLTFENYIRMVLLSIFGIFAMLIPLLLALVFLFISPLKFLLIFLIPLAILWYLYYFGFSFLAGPAIFLRLNESVFEIILSLLKDVEKVVKGIAAAIIYSIIGGITGLLVGLIIPFYPSVVVMLIYPLAKITGLHLLVGRGLREALSRTFRYINKHTGEACGMSIYVASLSLIFQFSVEFLFGMASKLIANPFIILIGLIFLLLILSPILEVIFIYPIVRFVQKHKRLG